MHKTLCKGVFISLKSFAHMGCNCQWNKKFASHLPQCQPIWFSIMSAVTGASKNALPTLRQKGKKLAISNDFSNKNLRKILEMAISSDLTLFQILSGFWILKPSQILILWDFQCSAMFQQFLIKSFKIGQTEITRNHSKSFELVGTQISANAVTVRFSAISADKKENLF